MKKHIENINDLVLISTAHHKAIVDLLLEKGIFTKEELIQKTAELAGLTRTELFRRAKELE